MRIESPRFQGVRYGEPLKDGAVARYAYNKGITTTGAGVSQWDDQWNGHHLLQATDSARPVPGSLGADVVGTWTTSSEVSEAGGVITFNTTTGGRYAATEDVVSPGRWLITYDVANYVSGGVIERIGGAAPASFEVQGSPRAANGTYSIILTVSEETSVDFFFVNTTSTTQLDVQNITVKEIDPLGGILTDGTATFLQTGAITSASAYSIYSLIKMPTWTLNDAIYNTTSGGTAGVYQNPTASPNIRAESTSAGTTNTGLAVDTWGVLSLVVNGTSYSLQVNNNSPVTDTLTAAALTRFTLGTIDAASGQFGSTQSKEHLIYNVAHGDRQRRHNFEYLDSIRRRFT